VQNPQTVDLLVSLAVASASEGVMDDPLPIGMGLRIPLPDAAATPTRSTTYSPYDYSNQPASAPEVPNNLQPGPDGLIDFDELTREQVSFHPLMPY
jgi:ubiquitin-conjugating enzyme E2 Q